MIIVATKIAAHDGEAGRVPSPLRIGEQFRSKETKEMFTIKLGKVLTLLCKEGLAISLNNVEAKELFGKFRQPDTDAQLQSEAYWDLNKHNAHPISEFPTHLV